MLFKSRVCVKLALLHHKQRKHFITRAALSQGPPRDAAVNFDRYQILQQLISITTTSLTLLTKRQIGSVTRSLINV